MRDFTKLKQLSDFETLDAPVPIDIKQPSDFPEGDQAILRMLVHPKYYNGWVIPEELSWLGPVILDAYVKDVKVTGIVESFCYVTVRHGTPFAVTDDEWHLDGASLRTDTIPERNYVWVDHSPTEYKEGNVMFPSDTQFDPIKHDLFSYIDKQLSDVEIKQTVAKEWVMMSPFCLHRRPKLDPNQKRTFIRISFTDIEIRDVNNTPNPYLKTEAFGRDAVKTFRDQLVEY